MIKKGFRFFSLHIFLNFFFCSLFGQYVNEISKPFINSSQQQSYNNHYLKPTALIIPGTFLLYGGLKPVIKGIEKLDTNIMAHVKQSHRLHTHAADYIMWAPSASLYLMDALKVETAHTFGEHILIDAGSIIITGGIGYGMRKISRNIKAYTTENTKFPSGHTANAFRGAEILHQELKESHKLLSYGGYLVATSVGAIRIFEGAHLLSEVIAGAGLGILSSKLTYWAFDKLKNKRNY